MIKYDKRKYERRRKALFEDLVAAFECTINVLADHDPLLERVEYCVQRDMAETAAHAALLWMEKNLCR